MRVSRLRESKLQSVGWSCLPGAFPPACSSLCNTHCNSAHWHLLGGAQKGHRVQTGSQGMNPAPHHSCLVFHFCSSSPGIPQTSTISSSGTASPSAEQWILPASLCAHRSERGYFSTVSASLLSPAKGKERQDAKERFFFFFSSGDEAKGTGINPSGSQKLLTWREKPSMNSRTIRSWRKNWYRDSLRKQPLNSQK